jgi:hypothetical protein
MMDEIVYICNRCGETFSLEDGKSFYSDEGAFTLCPSFGSTDIEQATRCPVCREIVFPYELKGGVCPECFGDAVAAYKRYLDYLEPWEREALDDHYGNIDVTERD